MSTQSAEGTLTVAALMRMVDAIGLKPRLRIIVGFPLVGEGEVLEHKTRGLLLMGRVAWESIKRASPPTPYPSHVESFTGIPVEHYGDRADHAELYDALWPDLTARRLLSRREEP